MTVTPNIVKMSVSDLVSFSCRTGDLVSEGPAGPTSRQGIKAHQKIQESLDDSLETEVSLKTELTINDIAVLLRGRMDILDPASSTPVITEIKSTLVPPSRIPATVQMLHWAQLKIYGYCYLHSLRTTTKTDHIKLTLLWINLQDDSLTPQSEEFSYSQLENFTVTAVERYLDWLLRVSKQRIRTRESAKALNFPHDSFRLGQRDLAAASYRIFRDSGFLLCEAPTGTGKTISTLFPAIKSIGDEFVEQLVYLTAKTSGRAVAQDALQQMAIAGLDATSLTLSSKASLCHCSNGTCERNSDGRCPLTIGFFDRLPEARVELIESGRMDDALINEVATRYQLCPFELCIQMIPWVSVVICDYNYVFDPLVCLSVYADPPKTTTLLLDESHNLVDRARGMYSARLSRSQNRQVRDECGAGHIALERSLTKLDRALSKCASGFVEDEAVSEKTPKQLTKQVGDSVEALVAAMDSDQPLPESAREWFRELFRYLVIESLYGDHHATVIRVNQRSRYKDVEVKLMCVNATDQLSKTLKKFRSVVAFSATLRPMQYYFQALGFPETAVTLTLPSPFPPENLGCFVCPFVNTRYQQREASIAPIVDIIHQVSTAKSGNYLVFFPSYVYMDMVYREYQLRHEGQRIVIQDRGFTLDDRAGFLAHFETTEAVLGFAIMGGVFGEGIDYVGDRLIGSIIVGTGLPGIGVETKLISEDYANSGLDGFDYAYRYPGFTKVLQTAGRVIRNETDRGVVVLIDQRFTEKFYSALYPEHWQTKLCRNFAELTSSLDVHWRDSSYVP